MNTRPAAKDQRSPLCIAVEDGTGDTIALVYARTTPNGDGCLLWQGLRTEGGYPRFQYRLADGQFKRYRVHRLVAAAALGDLRGVPVHRTCANRLCVNARHLQLARAHESCGDTLERRFYRLRISELESALREVSPGCPLVADTTTATADAPAIGR